MDKYQDKKRIDWTNDIILLNDKYADKGLYVGYIGSVVENLIEERGIVLADFFNPLTGEDIAGGVEIQEEDFRVYKGTLEDKKIGWDFKDLFRK